MNENGKTCGRVREELALYLDGRISLAEKSEINAHLSQCSSCERELQLISDSWNLLSAVKPTELPAGFEARFWAKSRRGKESHSILEKISLWPQWARAAVGIVSVTAVWVLGLTGGIKSTDIQRSSDQVALKILTATQPPNSIEEAYLRGPLSDKRTSL